MSRLIDADALKKDVLDLRDCHNGFSDTYDKACIIGVIEEQPTVEERNTGKWEKQRETYCSWSCSVCKEIVVAMPERMGYPMYDYCPNCGAKMEG